MINPYQPTESESLSEPKNRLLFIWIWLPIAIAGAMLSTPADIYSIVSAMAFSLPCFLAGAVWVCNLGALHRCAIMIVLASVSGTLATKTWYSAHPLSVAIAGVFALVSFGLGAKACGAIVHHRLRIFGTLSVTYTLGLLLNPLGIIILTIPALLFANRDTTKS